MAQVRIIHLLITEGGILGGPNSEEGGAGVGVELDTCPRLHPVAHRLNTEVATKGNENLAPMGKICLDNRSIINLRMGIETKNYLSIEHCTDKILNHYLFW